MIIVKQLCALFSLLALASCAASSGSAGHGMPSPVSSKYITGIGGGVTVNADNKLKPFKMSVHCRLNSSSPEPLYIVARFDSPAPGIHLQDSKPQRVNSGSEFDVISQPFSRIQNDKDYHVHLSAYRDPSRTQLSDEVTQTIRFTFPEKIQRLFGLEDNVL